MEKYKTTYIDDVGKVDTFIINSFPSEEDFDLTLEIDGIKFMGHFFDDFVLIEPERYNKEELERFTFNIGKCEGSQTFELCNCQLNFEIPITLIDKKTNCKVGSIIKVELELGKPADHGGIDSEKAGFLLPINGEAFSSEADMFEIGLDKLKSQIDNIHHFKNCYGCLYSDYNPFGNGFFGDLMCFKGHKDIYLELSSKMQLFDLIDMGYFLVQETYCCDEFEIRLPNIGYRG